MGITASTYVGQPIRRREDIRLITGNGRYVDDIRVSGMQHVAILRSPHARAILSEIDLSKARSAPGVRMALAGDDLVGRLAALDALERIDITYETLPCVIDEETAVAEGAPRIHANVPNNITTDFRIGGGDYAAARAAADHVLKLRLVNNRLIPTCLETRAILAERPERTILTRYRCLPPKEVAG